jgi:hypothetical protein
VKLWQEIKIVEDVQRTQREDNQVEVKAGTATPWDMQWLVHNLLEIEPQIEDEDEHQNKTKNR